MSIKRAILLTQYYLAETKPQVKEIVAPPVVQIQQHETQTFVLKPAVVQTVGTPNDPNLLPTSLQHALSQHQKAVGIPQTLHASTRNPLQVSTFFQVFF